MIPKIHIAGIGNIALSRKDFIASGGEGQIFGKGKTAYKIYHDEKKMIPLGKFDDLSALNARHIVNPQEILLNSKCVPCGYTMEYFKETEPICKVFANGFRKKAGFNENDAVKLVENMLRLIDFVHSKDCLIVDFNEINFLIKSSELTQPVFIDVDSYGTKNYPPTAITLFAKDYHSKSFSRLTDWFGFGIIAFQIFVGMHPYKGRLDGFKKNDVVERMKANKSVFNKKVKIPPAARDFSCIPSNLRSWMEDMFESDKRIEPPLISGNIKKAKPVFTRIANSDSLEIELVKSYDSEIYYHFVYMNQSVVRSGDFVHMGPRRYKANYKDSEIIVDPKTLIPIEISKKSYRTMDKDDETPISFKIDKIRVVGNQPLMMSNDYVCQVVVKKLKDYVLSFNDKKWNVLPLATKLFSGMVYQNVLGVPYLLIPNVVNNSIIGEFVRVEEIADYAVISAKCVNNVAIIYGYKDNKYSRIIVKFNGNKYDIAIKKNVDYQGDPNFIVLDKGIIVAINEDSDIEILRSIIGDNTTKIIESDQIDNSCLLSTNGSQVFFHKGNNLYKMRMK
ncbi:MAG: hypothetical protein JSU85_00695 [Candidatus Zixiibacteriota bacterium]|nr:MAG: hypothetical protein JSU85_00695 [candidate division Zixibacteria bacterium]